VAPLLAGALIALQVCSNAVRDGLFLTHFAVPRLPYLMAATALLAFPAARLSGRLHARFGPARVAPLLFAAGAILFLAEWMLLGAQPRAASVLLYFHASVLGAIAISAFWSLVNERFDPHSAKPLMARVAAAAAAGGFLGGLVAERAAALLGGGAVLLLMAAIAGACAAGALALGSAPSPSRAAEEWPGAFAGWHHVRGHQLLRGLALVIALSAAVAALADYLLKSEAVAYFGRGEPLVRFFGLFYAGTALASALIQSALGGAALKRLGLGGSVASHPVAVGAASVLGFLLPTPFRGVLPRALDQSLRNSVFRAGYEMHYTPIAPAIKRSAKPIVDVACDSAGKAGGAAAILVFVALVPGRAFEAVTLLAIAAAAWELHVARRLRAGYVAALEGGLRQHSGDLETQVAYVDFTAMEGVGGVDPEALRRALGAAPARPADPVVRAVAELRSGDAGRIQAALRDLPKDPLLIAALVPLLARRDLVRPAVDALVSFGPRAAGEMAAALCDPATSPVVRRRLPLALRTCPSPIARDGLLAGLDAPAFDIRLRCGRALLALTDAHPELLRPFPSAHPDIGRDIWRDGGPDPGLRREHLFNLLALAYEREPMRIAARSFASGNGRVRGTALEYLETVLPPALFSALRPLLDGGAPAARARAAADVREDLIRAGATMTVSRDDLRREMETEEGDAG
jgi:hypothetical protein